MTRANSELLGERFYSTVNQAALTDQSQGARHRARSYRLRGAPGEHLDGHRMQGRKPASAAAAAVGK